MVGDLVELEPASGLTDFAHPSWRSVGCPAGVLLSLAAAGNLLYLSDADGNVAVLTVGGG